MNKSHSLWNQLESKKITREELPTTLFKKLGQPTTELQQNLAQELIKKIISYYFAETPEYNHTIYSTVGTVQEIIHKRFKEGPKTGQSYYVLILSETKEKLQANSELLNKDKFSQVEKLALLGQNLVFQYRKWFANKQILDWHSMGKTKQN